jgi:hypothetical protein
MPLDGTADGRPDPPFSRRVLLETAVRSGAIYTATLDGQELPFEGAPFFAEELARDGLFELASQLFRPETLEDFAVSIAPDFRIWRPTDKGVAAVKGTSCRQ